MGRAMHDMEQRNSKMDAPQIEMEWHCSPEAARYRNFRIIRRN
ncbi:MAG: hypothetical protein ACLVG5_00390 [Clostridium sp.]